MKTSKILTISSMALAFSTMAHAWDSPEVALVLDYVNSSIGQFQVDRFDPSTGQSLGSYAQSIGTTPLGIQQVGNITHVFTEDTFGGAIADKVYNMSTGQFLGSHIVGNLSTYQNVSSVRWVPGASGQGAYMVQAYDNTGVFEYYTDYSTVAPLVYGFGGAPLGQMQIDQATSTVAILGKFGGINNVAYLSLNQSDPYHSPLTQANFTTDTYDGTNGTQTYLASVAFDGSASPLNSVVSSDYNIFVGGAVKFDFGFLQDYDPSNASMTGSTSVLAVGPPQFDQLAFGHNRNLYDVVWNGAPGGVLLFAFNAQLGQQPGFLGGVPISVAGAPEGFAMYAAPEPSSFLVLAPMAFVVLARRRKKS